jgi:dsDNA-specific endonuclease/ATPase MutS2
MLKEQRASFAFQVMKTYPDKTQDSFTDLDLSGSNKLKEWKSAKTFSAVRAVVDLHIEKLVDSKKGMSNFEILTEQLRVFEYYYEIAVGHYQPSLTVIHGVGEGVLKNEIHQLLKSRKEVSRFENRYHPLYGYGATEIYFQY